MAEIVKRRVSEGGTAKCDDGELFCEIISIYCAKYLACVSGGAIVPASADILVCVLPAVRKNVLHFLLENYVSFAHKLPLLI